MHWMTRRLRATLGHALVLRVCVLILLVTPAVAFAPEASSGIARQPRTPDALLFTRIDVPGAMFTTAFGVNDRSQVVGGFRDAGGVVHGFLWDKGIFTPIDVDVPGATRTEPTGINDRGQIVGTFTDAGGARRGFLWDKGVFTPIDVPGATATVVFGINDRGQIVGFFIDAGGAFHGFMTRKKVGLTR